MKRTILLSACLLAIAISSFAQYDGSKSYSQSDLIIDTIQGYDLVSLENCIFTDDIGAPQLPVLTVKYLIPVNAEVTGITINNQTHEIISGSYNIYPVQEEYLPNGMGPPDFVEPDSAIYSSSDPYPGVQIEIIDDGFMMAYHIVSIKLYPLEYIPAQQQLKLYTSIDFTIDYTIGECQIELPQRISQYRNELTEGFVKSQVENPYDFETTSGGALNIVNNNSGDKSLNMDFMPSLYGDIPDYIIITNELLKPEFEVLAEWKTKKGIPTLIVTTEYIYSEYTGVDKAEQIRKYLIDAYLQWGPSLFVLLGGDVNIIPARYGYPFGSYGIKVTDLYYATVEGNWNANRNHLWGEGTVINNTDQFDTSPDLFLGRAPVDNIIQAEKFIDKVISYEKLDNINENYEYLLNYLTTNFAIYRHYFQKYIWVNIMNQQTNPWFQLIDCCPPNDTSSLQSLFYAGVVEELTHQNFLSALNNSGSSDYGHFHFVLHSDHSGVTGLGANNSSITINEIDNLTNSPYQQVMISTGCDPNEFQYEDCIAEYYINAEGGGVAFLGYTSPGSEGNLYSPRIYFNSLFNMNETGGYKNGIASTNARLSSSSTALRGLNLLGDPEMPVWTNVPGEIDIYELLQFTTGINSISFKIENAEPTLNYTACFYKTNEDGIIEVFESQNAQIPSGNEINFDFEFTIDTPGNLYLTVSAHNYLPFEKVFDVQYSDNIHLYTSDFVTFDNGTSNSIGNGDLQPDAGEVINFAIELTNQGLQTASNVITEFVPHESESINESFETLFPPFSWEINDPQSITWNRVEQTIIPPNGIPADGLHMAHCNTSIGFNVHEARLVTSDVYLQNSIIEFSMFHVSDINEIGHMKIQISYDGLTWEDIPGALFYIYNENINEAWEEYEIDLSPYDGNLAKIGFLGKSGAATGIYDIYIDKISLTTQYITLDPQPCDYEFETIDGQGGEEYAEGCLFSINPNTPDQILVPFSIEITADGGYTETDEIYIQVGGSELSAYQINFSTSIGDDQSIGPNEDISIFITIFNNGHADAMDVNSLLSVVEPQNLVTVTAGEYTYGDIISKSSIKNLNEFTLHTSSDYTDEEIMLRLELLDQYGKQVFLDFDLTIPTITFGWPPPCYDSYENSIFIYWTPIAGAGTIGSNMYRKISGSYYKLNDNIIEGSSFYLDNFPVLDASTEYEYKITFISDQGIECFPYEFTAWTSLPVHEGWPLTIPELEFGEKTRGSPNVEDINNDGTKEIFLNIGSAGGLRANVLCFNHDGTDFIDEDPNNIDPLVNFQEFGFESPHNTNKCDIITGPALADVDNDGKIDLLVRTNDRPPGDDISSSTNLRLFRFEVTENIAPNPEPVWEYDEIGKSTRSPVISDVDFDNNFETLNKSLWSYNIKMIDENGINYNNWPVDLPFYERGRGMVVCADLDNDSNKEIIIGTDSYGETPPPASEPNIYGGIYIFRNNGEPFIDNNPDGLFFTNSISLENHDFHCPTIVTDFDGDNINEILGLSKDMDDLRIFIIETELTGGQVTFIQGWEYDNPDHELDFEYNYWNFPLPSVGDINDDDALEIVIANYGEINVWDITGNPLAGFPVSLPDIESGNIAPLLADIDSDENIEIIIATRNGKIHAYDNNGEKLDGYPINLPFNIDATPCIADIDYDGKNEIIASCRNQIYVWDTEGDANKIEWGMYRHDSYNSGVYGNSTCRYYTDQEWEINEGETETWDNKRLTSDVRIYNGGTLIIEGKVAMPEGSKIIVERGAELIIDGGTLTNACDGLWKGIELWGTSYQPQTQPYQGVVRVINGGTIENAEIGILTIKVEDPPPPGDGEVVNMYYTGGIVIAEDAVFRNNETAVKFYRYTQSSVSYFRECEFVTDDYLLSDAEPGYFIDMRDIASIRIFGSSFTDIRTGIPEDELTSGIESHDAGLYVLPQTGQACEFTGLYDGIRAYTRNPARTISIEDSRFIENLRSVYMSSIIEATITGNIFNPWDENIPGGEVSYCMYLDHCTDYTVEDNNFYYEGAEPDPTGIGLVINSSGPYNNEVYNNYFSNLRYATLAENNNRGEYYDDGLKIKCNDYEYNDYDIAVTAMWANCPGIARNQGAEGGTEMQAGNLFSQNNNGIDVSDYSTIKDSPINYYHHDPASEPRVEPEYYTDKYINLEDQGTIFIKEVSCKPHSSGGGGGTGSGRDELKGQMETNGLRADSTQAILSSLVDGGNSEVLEQEVLQSMPPETYDLYMSLMGKSPYLSDSVLIAAIEKENVLPNVLVKDILVANPQAAKSNEVMEKVDEKTNPMTEEMIAEILLGKYFVAAKEKLEAQVAYYRNERSTALKFLKQLYRNDTVNPWAHDSLVYLLETEQGLKEKYELVFAYTEQDNWTAAMNLLSNLPGQYSFNTHQQEMYDDYYQLVNVYYDLYQSGFEIDSISEVQKSTLYQLADNTRNIAGAYARNILIQLDDYPYREPVILPEEGLKSGSIVFDLPDAETFTPEYVKLYPNPARDYIIVELMKGNVSGAVIRLFDNQGRPVRTVEMPGKQQHYVLHIKDLQTGIYYLKVELNGKTLESKKFSKVN